MVLQSQDKETKTECTERERLKALGHGCRPGHFEARHLRSLDSFRVYGERLRVSGLGSRGCGVGLRGNLKIEGLGFRVYPMGPGISLGGSGIS